MTEDTRAPVRFLLGTHQPGWLAHAGVPLFVSDTRLRRYKTLPRAVAPFAVDSGGFTELQRHGTWTVNPGEYVARLRRLTSADSLAWSRDARLLGEPLPGCTRHKNCANCLRYALRWRTSVLAAAHTQRPIQEGLFDV